LIGSQDTDYVILSEKGEAAAYYPVKQEDKSKLFNENLLKEVFERSESAKEKYQIFSQKYISATTKSLNLAEFFDDYCSVYIDLVACFRTTRPVYVDSLVENLKEKLSATETGQEILSCLLISENDDEIRLEQIDWTSLLKKGGATPDDFKRHTFRYPWLFPSIYNYEVAIKKLTDRYSADLTNLGDKIKESEDIQKFLNKNLKEKKKYLNDCSEKEIQRLSKIITELSEFRTYFKLTLSGITFTFREILKEIASNANLEPDLFYNSYTIEDIKKLLLNKELLSSSVVNQRNEYYIYIVRNLKNEITSDKEYLTVLKDYFSTDKKSCVLGASASTGVVTGIARVLSNSEVKNLSEESLRGKILVTTMTDPSIMPFIRNCLAFVTDEGGLTSHAAIVSRELNIPCIVGTKNGTQAIKDGSLIEVNANNGIVNILKTQ
jgi:phosphohistidine swiveling domain-containing protein